MANEEQTLRVTAPSSASLIRTTALILSIVHPQVETSTPYPSAHETPHKAQARQLEQLDGLSLLFVHAPWASAAAITTEIRNDSGQALEVKVAYNGEHAGASSMLWATDRTMGLPEQQDVESDHAHLVNGHNQPQSRDQDVCASIPSALGPLF
jgi:hypothetical protein